MSTPDEQRAERMRELTAEFRRSVAQVHQASREATAAMRKLASTDVTTSPEYQRLEQEAAESFRSGRSGHAAQALQERVDRGELTWRQIREGTAGPDATRLYRENQTALLDETMRVQQALDDAGSRTEREAAERREHDDEQPMTILKKRSTRRKGEN
jgi:predicted transcriptional regulator